MDAEVLQGGTKTFETLFHFFDIIARILGVEVFRPINAELVGVYTFDQFFNAFNLRAGALGLGGPDKLYLQECFSPELLDKVYRRVREIIREINP